MLRKNPQLTAAEARKKLLLAESELNRAELFREVEVLKSEIGHVRKQIYTVGSIASSVALIGTVASIFRRRFAKAESPEGRKKTPWIFAVLEGARVGASLLSKFKSLFNDHDRK